MSKPQTVKHDMLGEERQQISSSRPVTPRTLKTTGPVQVGMVCAAGRFGGPSSAVTGPGQAQKPTVADLRMSFEAMSPENQRSPGFGAGKITGTPSRAPGLRLQNSPYIATPPRIAPAEPILKSVMTGPSAVTIQSEIMLLPPRKTDSCSGGTFGYATEQNTRSPRGQDNDGWESGGAVRRDRGSAISPARKSMLERTIALPEQHVCDANLTHPRLRQTTKEQRSTLGSGSGLVEHDPTSNGSSQTPVAGQLRRRESKVSDLRKLFEKSAGSQNISIATVSLPRGSTFDAGDTGRMSITVGTTTTVSSHVASSALSPLPARSTVSITATGLSRRPAGAGPLGPRSMRSGQSKTSPTREKITLFENISQSTIQNLSPVARDAPRRSRKSSILETALPGWNSYITRRKPGSHKSDEPGKGSHANEIRYVDTVKRALRGISGSSEGEKSNRSERRASHSSRNTVHPEHHAATDTSGTRLVRDDTSWLGSKSTSRVPLGNTKSSDKRLGPTSYLKLRDGCPVNGTTGDKPRWHRHSGSIDAASAMSNGTAFTVTTAGVGHVGTAGGEAVLARHYARGQGERMLHVPPRRSMPTLSRKTAQSHEPCCSHVPGLDGHSNSCHCRVAGGVPGKNYSDSGHSTHGTSTSETPRDAARPIPICQTLNNSTRSWSTVPSTTATRASKLRKDPPTGMFQPQPVVPDVSTSTVTAKGSKANDVKETTRRSSGARARFSLGLGLLGGSGGGGPSSSSFRPRQSPMGFIGGKRGYVAASRTRIFSTAKNGSSISGQNEGPVGEECVIVAKAECGLRHPRPLRSTPDLNKLAGIRNGQRVEGPDAAEGGTGGRTGVGSDGRAQEAVPGVESMGAGVPKL